MHVFRISTRLGQGALYLTLLIGGTSVLIGVTLAFLIISFGATSGSFHAANRALAIASSGIYDAMLQFARNPDFMPPSGTYCLPGDQNCPTPVPSGVTRIVITRDVPRPGQIRVISTAGFLGSQRKIEAIMAVDPVSTRVNIVSWRQLAF